MSSFLFMGKSVFKIRFSHFLCLKLIKKIPLAICIVLVACNSSKSPASLKSSSLPKHMEHFQLDGFWTYRTAQSFLDGGSMSLGFFDKNGDVLYVCYDFSMHSSPKYRRCYLRKTYNDNKGVELIPKSDLENKIILLIEKSICGGDLVKILPSRDEAIKILKTRDLKLRFSVPN